MRDLKPRSLTIIEYVLICAPMLIVWFYIHQFGVNVVFWDEWGSVNYLKNFYENGFDFKATFAFHNEHRVFFPRLVWLLLWSVSHFDSKFVMFFQQLFPAAAVCFLFYLFRDKENRLRSVLLFLPATLLWFTLAQFENQLWAFQLAFYMCQAFPVFSFCFMHLALNRERHNRLYFVLSMICAVIGSFSSGQGLFVWFGLVCGYLIVFVQSGTKRRCELVSFGITVLLTILSWAIYFHGSTYLTGHNHLAHSGTKYILEHPYKTLRYALLSIGNSLGVMDDMRMVFAILLITLTVFLIIKVILSKQGRSVFAFVALTAFAYGAIGSFVYGRAELNDYAASRYVTTIVLIPIGLYLALIKLVDFKSVKINLHIPLAFILIIGYMLKLAPSIILAENRILQGQRNVFNVLNYDSQPKQTVQSLFPWYGYIDPLVPFLKENNLSTFHDYTETVPSIDVSLLPVMFEGFDFRSVTAFDDLDGKICIKIDGAWVVDFNKQEAAKNVWVSVDGQLYNVHNFGSNLRQDVVDSFNNPNYLQSGFSREIRPPFDFREGLRHYVSLVVECEGGYFVSHTTVVMEFLNGALQVNNLDTATLTETEQDIRYIEYVFSEPIPSGIYQMFYANDGEGHNGDRMLTVNIPDSVSTNKLTFSAPLLDSYMLLRLDFPSVLTNYELISVKGLPGGKSDIEMLGVNDCKTELTSVGYIISTGNQDPFMVFKFK